MKNRRFKIREDLIISRQWEDERAVYVLINPLTGNTSRLDFKTYLILRHFNGRSAAELQIHLKKRHNLELSNRALESYLDLFLDLYLFDRGSLELYWKKLSTQEKEAIRADLRLCLNEIIPEDYRGIGFVEGLILNQAREALCTGNILSTIGYFTDLKTTNAKNALAETALDSIEKAFARIKNEGFMHSLSKHLSKRYNQREVYHFIRNLQTVKSSLKTTGVALAVICIFVIAGRDFIFNAGRGTSLTANRESSLRIIKTTGDILLQEKTLALAHKRQK